MHAAGRLRFRVLVAGDSTRARLRPVPGWLDGPVFDLSLVGSRPVFVDPSLVGSRPVFDPSSSTRPWLARGPSSTRPVPDWLARDPGLGFVVLVAGRPTASSLVGQPRLALGVGDS